MNLKRMFNADLGAKLLLNWTQISQYITLKAVYLIVQEISIKKNKQIIQYNKNRVENITSCPCRGALTPQGVLA